MREEMQEGTALYCEVLHYECIARMGQRERGVGIGELAERICYAL